MATLLFRKARAETADDARTAIIDIGSNSIRLVVYQGPARLPAILFNEKVMAGLGRSLNTTGAIDEESLTIGAQALARYAAVAREMEVANPRVVATAAVRDASNGALLIDKARALGLKVELLTGEEEATASGLGVLSAIPGADGIVGDLGGGSLELVRVSGGVVHERASFPLGVLRLGGLRKKPGALDKEVARVVDRAGWAGKGSGLPLYLVGGSWRALARLDMHHRRYPLPIIHQYEMDQAAVARLGRTISHVARGKLRAISSLSSARVPTLGDAAALLAALLRHLGSERTVVSAFGLREGLLYAALEDDRRAEDPLIVAARDEAKRSGRFAEHGDVLDRWVAPLFGGEPAEVARLRHAACLLADVGWRANPEFRAERGVEIALHGNWVAIDAAGRAQVAQALFTGLGGGLDCPDPIPRLAPPEALERATDWGLAIRLGQRLSGGVVGPLQRSRLSIDHHAVTLHLQAGDRDLYGDAVERRHKALANAMNREAKVQG